MGCQPEATRPGRAGSFTSGRVFPATRTRRDDYLRYLPTYRSSTPRLLIRNIDPRRKRLVEKFVELVGTRYASTSTWAILWLGDIDKLEDCLNGPISQTMIILAVEEDLKLAQLGM
jgi:hypothetical protein